MHNRLPPIIGNWYSHRDKGEIFQVVALDEASGTIEIQEFDGDIDELDFDEWQHLPVDVTTQPEDWTGPIDDIERDELGYTDLEQVAGGISPAELAATSWEQSDEDDDADEMPLH